VIIAAVFGLAYQLRLDPSLERGRFAPDFLEIAAEPFYKITPHRLRWLASGFPLVVRCASLSIGSPEPIDEQALASCVTVVQEGRARWLTVPLGFSRAGEIDLGLSVPIAPSVANLRLVSDHLGLIAERCGLPLVVENICSSLRLRGDLSETEFFNRLCIDSGCRLLIDLAALSAAARAHGFDSAAWLDDLDPHHVAQLRVTFPSQLDDEAGMPRVPLGDQLTLMARLREDTGTPRAIVLSLPRYAPLTQIDPTLEAIRSGSMPVPRHDGEQL
jgi:uncharacterized protein (UPF0276 family)